MHPTTGELRCRLDASLQHLPDPDSRDGKTKCALHRFVNRGYEVKKNVMSCSICRVSLCIHCYTIFHANKSVSVIKEAVEHIVEELDQCPAVRENQIENEKKN